MSVFAQTDEARKEKMRQEIGWDYSVSDFNLTRIDDAVMGTRNASICRYLEKYFSQNNNLLSSVLQEQMGQTDMVPLEIKELKVLSISKQGSDIEMQVKTWQKATKNVGNQAVMTFQFTDGVSSNNRTNTLFSRIGRYVQMKER